MSKLFVAFILQKVVLASCSAAWSVESGRFVDSHGRERIFHGVNVVYKSAPYVPITTEDGPLSFTVRDAGFLQQLGLNVVRLGVMWGGVEPTKGSYNQSYLDEINTIIRICEEHNIQVLIDFHQDNLSELFCGEGIPWWAAYNYGPAYRNFPAPISGAYAVETRSNFVDSYAHAEVPSINDCDPLSRNYNEKMASYALARNYEDLYTNGRGLRDLFVAYWSRLAKEFKGNDNIIGFELINEPASLWARNHTESVFLQPLYDILAEAIEKIDPDRVVFFNPVTWDHGYAPTDAAMPSYENGFSHAPGGRSAINKSVYAFHYYDYDFHYHGDGFFKSKVGVSQQLGTASMVTEFSLEHVEDESGQGYDHFNYAMDLMDSHLLSWMAWSYKGYYPVPYLAEEQLPFVGTCTGCESGLYPNLHSNSKWQPDSDPMSVSWDTAKALARPYAQAVQGRIKSMHYDKKNRTFQLAFQFDPRVPAPTVIFVNRVLGGGVGGIFAQGVQVDVPSGFRWRLNGTSLTISADARVQAGEVTVVVAPKQDQIVWM